MKELKFKFSATGKSDSIRVTLHGEMFAQDAVTATNLSRAIIAQQHPRLLIQRISVKQVRS